MRQFQLGDDLFYDIQTGELRYDTEDASKKIISHVSVSELKHSSTQDTTTTFQAPTIQIKVAKNSPPEPLTSDEMQALRAYMNQTKILGTVLELTSLPPDKIQLEAAIIYDAEYELTTFKNSINEALDAYIKTLRFDGIILRNKIIETLRSVPGVFDVRGPASDNDNLKLALLNEQGQKERDITRQYATRAGYIVFAQKNLSYLPQTTRNISIKE